MNKDNNVRVSVVIPVYNAEAFIEETIRSVLEQTFTDFELLLLDDGSTDGSADIIKSYDDPRIRYIPCKHDFIGTHRAGYKMAKGKYIAHLDHDDLMVKDRLQMQYDFLEANPEIMACGGYVLQFGKCTGLISMPLSHSEIATGMMKRMTLANSTGFIRRDFLLENNIKHRRGYSYAADYKFWIDIAKSGKIANIPEVLTFYRTSDSQASIIYFSESQEASQRIQYEILEFFISRLKKDHPLSGMINQSFPLSMDDLRKLDFSTRRTYFDFMHELIKELMGKEAINCQI